MKKLFILMFAMLFVSTSAMASPEINALRQVKKAKMKGVNRQIKECNRKMQQAAVNPQLTEAERNKIFNENEQKLIDLYTQKEIISEQYKQDKKNIKEME